jgi:hypothetical protein
MSTPSLRSESFLQLVQKGLLHGHHEDGHHHHEGSKDARPEWHVTEPSDLAEIKVDSLIVFFSKSLVS